MENTIEILKEIIEDVADIPQDEIDAESALIDDLDLSSLEIMSIISSAEKKFSIKISESEMLSISTVEELAEVITDKLP
ncbi:acyl carrier protein [Butyrivibrio sp. AE2032]|uniref:acyl carrier protein n=1 Tax=Butyrivibrio sp. AE2032 TaxID=1458463 RepID=UPI0005590B12|nr:phosphopantetheine-binding protein [Butyrivibrio sp. AE2032]